MGAEADAALLQLIWLASPALPVGGFSYSEGLEGAVDCGLVTNEATAAQWLVDQLHLTLGRSDLAVLAQATAAWRAGDGARIEALNDWVLRTRETSELRQQTEQMGRSMVEWMKSVRPELAAAARLGADRAELSPTTVRPAPSPTTVRPELSPSTVRPELSPTTVRPEPVEGPSSAVAATSSARTDRDSARSRARAAHLTYPVAFALAASATTATERQIALAFAFSWAENMVQAAIKSVPLGQSAGQRILQRLAAEIPLAVDEATALSDDNRQAFSPMLAILSARHEHQYSRLFRS
jgi:urease accessory protein